MGHQARFRKTIFSRRSNLAPEHSITEIDLLVDDASAPFVVFPVASLARSWRRTRATPSRFPRTARPFRSTRPPSTARTTL